MFTAENLETFLLSDKPTFDGADLGIKILRRAVDRAAERLAKSNRQWHDDPQAEDHATYHAPTDVQFPRKIRDRVCMELAKRFLRIANENERLLAREVQ